ncbi:MAG: PAS domain S-box protein [Anaerolineae bacterium]|nr:PAS domain S-box protein [Anaerolineae bacterium]
MQDNRVPFGNGNGVGAALRPPSQRKFAFYYAVGILLILFIVRVVTSVVERRAIVQNERLFNEQQALQTLLAKQAIEDHIHTLFIDTHIFLKHFIVGYVRDNYEVSDLNQMFRVRLQEDPERLGYFYFKSAEEIVTFQVADTPAGQVALQMATVWASMQWAEFVNEDSEFGYVPPFYITREYQMFGVLSPFYMDGELQGMLLVVVDFMPLIQRYIEPMRSGQYGAAYVLDGRGQIIFDHETEIIGRNVFDGMHASYPDVIVIDQRLIHEDQGTGDYSFTVQRGGEVKRKLIAWHTLQIGSQKFIIALSAPDSEIGDALVGLRAQQAVLSGVLILSLLLVSGAFFHTRQRFLTQNAVYFEKLVQQRTAELAASEARYRAITELTPDAIIVYRDSEILFANQAAAELVGVSQAEILQGKSLADFGIPEDGLTNEDLRPSDTSTTTTDHLLSRVDGKVLIVAISMAKVIYQGRPAVISIMRDVTERRRAAEALLRLSTAVKMTADSVVISDLEGWIIEVNEAARELLGEKNSIIGKNIFDLMIPEDRARAIANVVQVLERGTIRAQEYQVVASDARVIPVEVTISVMKFEDETPVGLVSIIRDVTERKRAEAALQESEIRYRSFVQSFQGIAFRGKLDFSTLFFHGAVEAITGYTEAEFASGVPRWDTLIFHQDLFRLKESMEKIARVPNYATEREYRIVRKDGTLCWVREHIQNIVGEDGTPEFVQGAIYDVTEFKRLEEERMRFLIAEHEQRLLAETLTEVTLALTSQTRPEAVLDELLHQVQRIVPFTTANIALLEGAILRVVHWQGYPLLGVESFVGGFALPLADLPLDVEVIETRRAMVIPNVRENERWRVFEETAWIKSSLIIPICLRDRVLGVLRLDGDMLAQFSDTDAVRLQPLANAAAIAIENAKLVGELEREVNVRAAEIIAERDKNDAILRSVGDAIAVVGRDLQIQYVNAAFVMQTGYTLQEVLGKNLDFLISQRVPAQFGYNLHQAFETSGALFPDGTAWSEELTLQRKDGRIYEAALTVAPIHDAAGGLLGYVASHQDISRFKALDKARSQFMFHISQQLRTPVTTLELYVHLLRSRDRSSANQRYLQALEVQTDQLAHLTQDILEITALDSGQAIQDWKPVSLSYLIGNLDVRYRDRAAVSNLTLTVHPLPVDLPVIKGDQERLSQALGEVVENALTFTPSGGQVMVTVATAVRNTWNWLTLIVEDTGPGLTEEELEHLFERFYRGRLTEAGNIPGTGLGLSIAQAIVQAHGGDITVQSQLDEGSRFTIWLPLAV